MVLSDTEFSSDVHRVGYLLYSSIQPQIVAFVLLSDTHCTVG